MKIVITSSVGRRACEDDRENVYTEFKRFFFFFQKSKRLSSNENLSHYWNLCGQTGTDPGTPTRLQNELCWPGQHKH